ncbi:DUF2594 family protein [Shimwellia blattae]|uniref:DUF2594 family protein n=1 Tax=Shimwellia blattae (strain ATCC 29907 / DSM 4481 / JCM 1650 / NBRC 105725 / CDC 9005-74) TaxID=630626 RepID=I2B7Z4_SHIBC|nr:DUF2594 family protein [Shimwellia blattae]AFJ46648.1 hypothetical protein EBL_c15510 [Shimwellia blattae DSM 4481 = NBRC 105725]GAB80228.1 hypothetical protein YecF [Shimwellia blattae DSM 4481 = NBRC 105725]VDY64121.1 Protein of uncharacterised function (DUF2594) [Shimwellia blattae]VEC22252.1 Protein of uncharacterised function (DUF2594) [Shimwellia blattae]
MSTPDFSTRENAAELALELSCMKALFTQMLKAMGQADAGKVIIKMEKEISQMENSNHAEAFTSTLKQIKQAYRQ